MASNPPNKRTLNTHVTVEEMTFLKTRAGELGITVTVYVRSLVRAVMGKPFGAEVAHLAAPATTKAPHNHRWIWRGGSHYCDDCGALYPCGTCGSTTPRTPGCACWGT